MSKDLGPEKPNYAAKNKYFLACSEKIRNVLGSPRRRLKGKEAKQRRRNYLHNLRVCAGSRTVRFADEVRLRVGAAEALVPAPQPPITVGRGKTHAVTLLACEVSRVG